MKVLITGGAGFIGSHLAEFHLERGDEVHLVDDFSTGQRENLTGLETREGLTVEESKLLDFTPGSDFVRGLDRIYHLAAAVGVQRILDRPIYTLNENIDGARHVFDLALDHDVTVFFASTSEVYGKHPTPPFEEDQDRVMGPTDVTRWGYANSKAIGEHYAFAYHEKYDLPVVVGRFFNIVGPRQTGSYGMVIPRFVQQSLREQPITVYGDGDQTRCFADVRDVVLILDSLLSNPEAVGQPVNLGSARSLTILELARMVKELTGSPSSIVHRSYEEAYGSGFEDMQRRQPDLRRLQSLVPEADVRPLEDTINDVINFYRTEGVGS